MAAASCAVRGRWKGPTTWSRWRRRCSRRIPLGGRPTTRSRGGWVRRRPGGALRCPSSGASRELAALRDAWLAAQRGEATALVRGPSGVGKSALIARFADALRSERRDRAGGRCHERVAMPYKAVHGIAAALATRLRDDRGCPRRGGR